MHGVETSRRMSLNVRALDQTGAKPDPEDVHKISVETASMKLGVRNDQTGTVMHLSDSLMAIKVSLMVCLFDSGFGCVFVLHGRVREAGIARLS
jgi:hypothetical protein